MYRVVKTDEKVIWGKKEDVDCVVVSPAITLADEFGGRAQIIVDDQCYVLLLKQHQAENYNHTAWWFKEAVEAIRGLETISLTSQ